MGGRGESEQSVLPRKVNRTDEKQQARAEFEIETVEAIQACLDAMRLCQALLQDLLEQHRLRDRAWRGTKVVPLKRVGAGE